MTQMSMWMICILKLAKLSCLRLTWKKECTMLFVFWKKEKIWKSKNLFWRKMILSSWEGSNLKFIEFISRRKIYSFNKDCREGKRDWRRKKMSWIILNNPGLQKIMHICHRKVRGVFMNLLLVKKIMCHLKYQSKKKNWKMRFNRNGKKFKIKEKWLKSKKTLFDKVS